MKFIVVKCFICKRDFRCNLNKNKYWVVCPHCKCKELLCDFNERIGVAK